MSRYGLLIDLDRCTNCYSCVVACKQYFNTREGVDYNQGRTIEWGEGKNVHVKYLSTQCMHCDDAPCHEVCPTGATTKSPQGPVLTNDDKCIGCGACVKVCKYNQRFLTETEPGKFKAEKCTLCQDRLENGEEPICVALCPGHCRIFGDLDDPESEINYYIKLYGAVRVKNTSTYYVIPEGMPIPEVESGLWQLEPLGKKLTPEDPEFRATTDGLIAAQDILRMNTSEPPEETGGEYKYSHCVMCNHVPRCGIKALVKDGKILRLERREQYGNETLCPMGAASVQDIYSPDRVLYPMRRTNPKGERSQWKRITWEEAYAEIAEKFSAIKEKYGAEKVLFMTGDPKEPRAIMQRLAYTFGSPNFGTESSTCSTATTIACKLIYGINCRSTAAGGMGATPDATDTSVAIIWGNNPGNSAAWSYDKMKTTKEFSSVKYIVIDPRVTSTVENFADVHIQLRPGTDGAIALFFADRIIKSGNYDKEFVANWAHGFEEYKNLCAEYTLEKTARITDVPEETLAAAAKLLTERTKPITVKSSSAQPHHTNGTDNFRAMMLLVPLTGSLDIEGGHLIPTDMLDVDLSGSSFKFAKLDLYPEIRHKRVDTPYHKMWDIVDIDGNIQINSLPEYVQTGAIRACLMLGGNAMMWGQSHEYQQAFADMDFVAAVDFRDNPWTHDYVDMLLPAAMSYERAAPLTFAGRRIFLREPVVPPQGEARSDYRICCDIGCALGYSDVFFGGGEKAEEECIREVLRTLGGSKEVTLEELRAAVPDGISIPIKGGPKYKKWELGLLRSDGKPGFDTPSGKVEFMSEVLRENGLDPLPRYREPVYSPLSTPEVAEKFPLVMCCGSRVPFYSNAKERELPWLRRFLPEPTVRLNTEDAAARGLKSGDYVRVTAPVNETGIVVKLDTSETIKPGMIDILHGWESANANELITRDFDPISGFVPFREGLCEVTAVRD
ncbi:MAG: molybdopterin-dependent oxidoreductase [Oscillospiraceae bacterium]|jgi:anaerobic selenocysteine-containing dehydrogenase/Fe-S-cluster-containing dehydrogenase component|nr:molybdopterin-dependent oxidoreductase [Oscillospiraceae bacterium]